VEEVGGGGGMPVFYLGTIMKNITLDGWLVISSLIVLMVVSWVVFLNKAFFVWMAGKENKAFTRHFEQMTDPLAETQDAESGFQNSNLYRVYKDGCRGIEEHRANGNGNDRDGMLKVLKADLERGYIEETKRLNSWIVLLTMAITGGPFLGLLGTVWGVMNTFAAMAEAGEANIMAIAPGVASALSTTVFGLLVAIPALFAYNFLTSRIKSIMADLTVFIDQFALKVEQRNEVSA
jgi:biopolymer transport protein ExbB